MALIKTTVKTPSYKKILWNFLLHHCLGTCHWIIPCKMGHLAASDSHSICSKIQIKLGEMLFIHPH